MSRQIGESRYLAIRKMGATYRWHFDHKGERLGIASWAEAVSRARKYLPYPVRTPSYAI